MTGPTLAEHTTLRVGGPAREWVVADAEDGLVEAVRECDQVGMPVLVLGGGSNLVVSDEGFPGTVVQVATRGVAASIRDGQVSLTLEAGEPWDEVVAYAVEQGWAGIEALSGIPGLVGATPIQNVGAYGQDISAVLGSVRVLDRTTMEVGTLEAGACGFGYRSSVFKREPGRWVVLGLTLLLRDSRVGQARYAELARTLGVDVDGAAGIDDIRAAVLLLRRRKGMVLDPDDHDTWSAGSFFTNPVVADDGQFPPECPRYPADEGTKLSAAWLIEHAGMPRGFALAPQSPAAISGKHTLALTNRGGATAADILALAEEVRRRVRAAFGIDLALEPVVVSPTP